MNDIEKNFQESLQHHEVAPPPAVWDQLSASLVQKRKRKAVWYWRAAAAVTLLLLGTGTLITLLRSEPAEKVVRQQQRSPAPRQEESSVALAERTEATDSVPAAAPSSAGQVASSVMADQKRVAEVEQAISDEYQQVDARLSQPIHIPAQSPNVPSAQEPESLRVAALQPTVPKVTSAPLPTTPANEVLPSAKVQPDRSATEELASSDPLPTDVVQRRTVTVIYKPGNRASEIIQADQNDKFFSKTLSFLEDLKKNGLAFSELRSAKSDLINNVFLRDRTNQQ